MTSVTAAAHATALRRASVDALHSQLAARLLEQVGHMRSGEQLPTELDLMQTYRVSRTTVRRAVQELVDRGVLVRRQGKGTFVSRPDVTQSLNHVTPFRSVLDAAGKPWETRIVDFEWRTGAEVPGDFGEQARVLSFRRLYSSEGTPHALLHYQVAERFGAELTEDDIRETPLLHVLERKYDLIVRRAKYVVQSRIADAEQSQLLEIPAGAPILVLHRFSRTPADEIIEITSHYLRPEVYELSVAIDETNGLSARTPITLGRVE